MKYPTIRIKNSGFTIVELLIVIVVIAILAATSVVAYRGIQDRANDAAIRSDISNAAKKVQLVAAETGAYPAGGMREATAGAYVGAVSTAPQPSVDFSASKLSYLEPTNSGAANFTYCTGPDLVSGSAGYVLSAQTKSRKIHQYSSMRGFEVLGTTSLLIATVICDGLGYPRSYSYGYFTNTGGWQSWVK